MSPVHSGGRSPGGGSLTLLKRWPPEAWQSRVFATWVIFPFLHCLVGGRGSTNKEFSTWIGLRETSREAFCWAGLGGLEPAAGTLRGQRTFILVLSWAIFSHSPRSDP